MINRCIIKMLIILMVLTYLAGFSGFSYAQIGGKAGLGNYTGGVSIIGNSGNGADQINATNVNGKINAATYGFSTSNSAATNTTTLQNAYNAASSANALLEIPPGTYLV